MKEQLKTQYEHRFATIQNYRNEVWRVLAESFFQQYIPPAADVLDIGCGWGEFINNVRANRKIAMDLNDDARQHLHPDIEFINQDCSAEWPLADNTLDVAFASNFFEHLPSKSHIERTITQARRCLKLNGRLICLGPNIRHLPGRYWDFWDHHVPITEMSLSELLEINAFVIERCVAKFLPYTMANRQPRHIGFLKLYLSLPIAWRLFGRQFLIIAKKAANSESQGLTEAIGPA